MEKSAFAIYMTVLVVAPVLFGAVHSQTYSILFFALLVASLLMLLSSIEENLVSGQLELRCPKSSLNLLFVLMLVLPGLQAVPLPAGLVAAVSPESVAAAVRALPAAETVGSSTAAVSLLSVTPYLHPVRMSAACWTVYGLFCLGLTRALDTRRRIGIAVLCLLATAVVDSLYGLLQTHSGASRILWLELGGRRPEVTGSFINRNHFAGYLGMCLILAVAYLGALSERRAAHSREGLSRSPLRLRLARLFQAHEKPASIRVMLFVAAVILGVALVLSGSRGGLISAAAGLLAFGCLLALRRGERRKGLIVLALMLFTLLCVPQKKLDHTAGRFTSLYSDIEGRARYARKTMELFGDYRWLGVGVGNFQYAYPAYQSPTDLKVFIGYAHNDWAQFLAEAGMVGMGLLAVGVGCHLVLTLRLWRRRHDPFAVCLGLAPVAVLSHMALYSCSDFNLHIPANFLVLGAIVSIGCSALHIERRGSGERNFQGSRSLPLKPWGALLLAALVLLMGTAAMTIGRHFAAELNCPTVPNSTLRLDSNPSYPGILAAIAWDPGNSAYWVRKGEALAHLSRQPTQGRDSASMIAETVAAFEQAVRLNPLAAGVHLKLGWQYTYLWQEPDYYSKWLPAADLSMERAVHFLGDKEPHWYQELGNYWLMRSKTFDPAVLAWEVALTKAKYHYRKGLDLERGLGRKAMLREIRDYVWNLYPDREFLEAVTGNL